MVTREQLIAHQKDAAGKCGISETRFNGQFLAETLVAAGVADPETSYDGYLRPPQGFKLNDLVSLLNDRNMSLDDITGKVLSRHGKAEELRLEEERKRQEAEKQREETERQRELAHREYATTRKDCQIQIDDYDAHTQAQAEEIIDRWIQENQKLFDLALEENDEMHAVIEKGGCLASVENPVSYAIDDVEVSFHVRVLSKLLISQEEAQNWAKTRAEYLVEKMFERERNYRNDETEVLINEDGEEVDGFY